MVRLNEYMAFSSYTSSPDSDDIFFFVFVCWSFLNCVVCLRLLCHFHAPIVALLPLNIEFVQRMSYKNKLNSKAFRLFIRIDMHCVCAVASRFGFFFVRFTSFACACYVYFFRFSFINFD